MIRLALIEATGAGLRSMSANGGGRLNIRAANPMNVGIGGMPPQ